LAYVDSIVAIPEEMILERALSGVDIVVCGESFDSESDYLKVVSVRENTVPFMMTIQVSSNDPN
jgi:hypothetical protein